MKRVFPIIILVFLFAACEKESFVGPADPKPSDQILNELEEAFNANSSEQLKSILDDWAAESVPKAEKSLSSEREDDIYEIFKVLYSPFDINRLGDHEWNELYDDYEYAVVQNQVYFNYAYDSEYSWEDMDSITDFRPKVEFPGKTILYLTENYHAAIYEFLGLEYNPLGTGGIMNPAYPTGESYERLQFLHNYLAIIPGHWGGYYHIETHPEVNTILFNENATRARAYFRVGYMFGEAEFRKDLARWKMTESAITGIEK